MNKLWSRFGLFEMLQREFKGYNAGTFRQDLLAGITVGAVALPLALAFGVASGADAAAGIVTAILAGIIIAALGGAPFQISGPTGAMSAVLIVLAQRYGLEGIWAASLIAGIAMLLLGVFRLGRYIAFIPSPVITGFTSGIALIIAIGQIDNVLGVSGPPSENSLEKLFSYFIHPVTPDWRAVGIAGLVALTMIVWPRINKSFPGSLVGIILATIMTVSLGWDIAQIGEIPRTILLEHRLTFSGIPWGDLNNLIAPAISIAALGAVESLLCGSVGSTMTGKPFDSNQELIGQGIGNVIIPFFGGVPATAAIARTSVAVKSGGVTRMTSIIHAVVLLLSALVLSPLISKVPLAALGGVLMVTAWRMNEWEAIRFYAHTRLKHALVGMLVTMVATVALDLTQAILIGIAISALLYIRQSASSLTIASEPVRPEKLRTQGHSVADHDDTIVYYLSGPLFFGTVNSVLEAFKLRGSQQKLILSMRGVPLIDVMGVEALKQIVEQQRHIGGDVYFSGLQPSVNEMFKRSGLLNMLGEDHIFWSADQAIVAISTTPSA